MDSADNISAWPVDGITDATKDHRMIRKADVCVGNIGDWSLSDGSNGSSEWIVGFADDYSDLNTHTSNCINTSSIEGFESNKVQIVEIRDVLGRKTKIKNNKPLLFIYNDGKVEKRIIIKK